MAKDNNINITLNAKDNASSKLGGVWSSASSLGWKLKALGGPLKALWIAAVASAWTIAYVWKQMYDLAETATASINKSKIVFGEYYDEIDNVAKQTATAMGLSRVEYLKTAAGIQDLLIPMGFARKEATEQTTKLMGLSGALAEWSAGQYNAAQVGDILAKAMLGEREQLKSLWISISQDEIASRLAAEGKKNLTGASLAQAQALITEQLIFEKSTDAQKAYLTNTDSLSRKKAELSATIENLKNSISLTLVPAFNEVLKVIAPVIESVAKNIQAWFENKENVDALVWTLGILVTGFKFVVEVVKETVSVLYSMFKAIYEALSPSISELITLFTPLVSWIIQSTKAWWENEGGISLVHKAGLLLLNVLKATVEVFVAIVSGIFAVGDALGFAAFKIWEFAGIAKDKFIEVREFLKEALQSFADVTSSIFQAIRDNAISKFQAIIDFAKSAFESVTALYNKISGVVNTIKNTVAKVGATVWNAISGTKANGGPVEAGKSYVVWERGAEIFTPSTNGSINSGGGFSWSIQINLWGVTVRNEADENRLASKIQSELVRTMQLYKLWVS